MKYELQIPPPELFCDHGYEDRKINFRPHISVDRFLGNSEASCTSHWRRHQVIRDTMEGLSLGETICWIALSE